MSSGLYAWWGMRVREPLWVAGRPITIVETCAAGLLLSALLQVAWMAWLVIGLQRHDLRDVVIIPLALVLIPTALLLVLPRAGLDAVHLSTLMSLSRERGGLRRTDRWIVLLGLACVVLVPFAPRRAWLVSAALAAFSATAASFVLGYLQQRVVSVARRRHDRFPPWLRQILEEEDEGRPLQPELDADAVLEFETRAGQTHRIGVALPATLVQGLRALNREHKGRLWRRQPVVVVRGDRAPVDESGSIPLRALCAQIASVSERDGLSRWELANQVLAMVQREVAYQFDEVSTDAFEGGPFEDYGRFALETVNDRVGDCECTAIMCASILSHLGFRTALIIGDVTPKDGGPASGHVVVGVSAEEVPGLPRDNELSVASCRAGHLYVCGETAIDGGTLPFGVMPLQQRGAFVVTEVLPIVE